MSAALREAAQQALEALEWHYHQGHSNTLGGLRLKIDEKALRNLRAALAQPSARQVSPAAFAEIVKSREEIVGVPVYWAQWPNKETP